ncbi:14-3-3 domain containing protein [Stylonychia lemnae]|uniref:14-3-3 domain containing protein n=1 Tax=Stylonychia lemnae TaxID=5949 RepID=A0A078AX67_STYLE|nr:14-3-3 domain containing protein [Stylonychia lemnae]|eukprot:CDW87045.1 14-3-3 domain containing protein [Stylonychia lemnae]
MSIEENIFLARVAEQAERFDDMVNFLKPVLDEKGGDITSDERNLLSVAFKNLISSKRTACRTIQAIEQNPKYQKFSGALGSYKKQIEEALYKDCENIISIIQSRILNKASESEARAFFVKMVGDYYRYIAETATGDRLEGVKTNALKAYQEASAIDLPACNATKLGLALNFSVFHYEVLKDEPNAITIAESALAAALDKIDDLDENGFNEVKSIIELLKENISLWKEDAEQ